ncbi:DUF6458 family protein [Actinomadura livida]|uniref:Uncharacterized membrane protein YidH (DUF202 family) n=1 Tax=Actinomadura livida TaxID=79909 RepID=A0A7W7IH24_9ACTN|nr:MULTISPECIES: DUF6458 family protein [Actinomadura]MBB4776987.1 uncharacterized membrane protein YidH (DUF202 family) [Actinomadura catellatispora]GGT96216.1 hypothetical protein GCM10010208_19580 [Actinomadura livida]
MTIGGSIALLIIGAILAYAVNYDISGIDIRLVGVILMVGGLVGLVVGIVRIASARRAVDRRPPPPVVREEHYYEDEYRRGY